MALLGGQFKSATHGQFKSAQGGHFDRILHSWINCLSFPLKTSFSGTEKSGFIVVFMCCILGVQHKFPIYE